MKKTKNRMGFTLVEMVVVIAIIGVLAAILVPSIINYVRKARLKADITTGKLIAEEVYSLIADDPEAYGSFYLTRNKDGQYQNGRWIWTGSLTDLTVQCEGEDPYYIRGVTVLNGRKGASGKSSKKWDGAQTEGQYFQKLLNEDESVISGNNEYVIPMRSDELDGLQFNRWYICHRIDKKKSRQVSPEYDTIEIWMGNGNGTKWGWEPNYRLFPAPAKRVGTISY